MSDSKRSSWGGIDSAIAGELIRPFALREKDPPTAAPATLPGLTGRKSAGTANKVIAEGEVAGRLRDPPRVKPRPASAREEETTSPSVVRVPEWWPFEGRCASSASINP